MLLLKCYQDIFILVDNFMLMTDRQEIGEKESFRAWWLTDVEKSKKKLFSKQWKML